jgi:hypothetical protein
LTAVELAVAWSLIGAAMYAYARVRQKKSDRL